MDTDLVLLALKVMKLCLNQESDILFAQKIKTILPVVQLLNFRM